MQVIRNNLAVLMGQRKVKLEHVMRATGLSRPALTALYYERNKMLAYHTLEMLCRYFEIQPGEFLYMVSNLPTSASGRSGLQRLG